MYSYSYSLVRRGVVATFDLSAKNLSAFQQDHWLSNSLNVIVLHLKEKAYVEAPSAPPATPAPPGLPASPAPQAGGTKRRWTSASPFHPPVPRMPLQG